jgi:outer membrane protein OmpA-like peptidoglycan-associated protein
MARNSGSDHLAHSFTDLMTSLMVIFILLLLVFLNNRASVNVSTTQALLADLRKQMQAGKTTVELDPKDPFTVVLAIPNELLTFEPNAYELRPEGESFLRQEMPRVASLLCEDRYRNSIESVIVEGHSDRTPYRGVSAAESESLNLKLSQDRSMEVVKKSLTALGSMPTERGCFLEKLSASARGEQDAAATPEMSRRVVFKIRVNSLRSLEAFRTLKARSEPARPPLPPPPPAAMKVLRILSDLRATPPAPVNFQLTDAEINEYLVYSLLATPRPGLESITVKVFPHNYISTFAVVDFDAVERWNPGAIPAVFQNVLNGKKTILLDYRFQVSDAKATFSIEKAQYQDVDLPEFLVRRVLKAIAARQPEHYDTDKPLPLPLGLKQVTTSAGTVLAHN